MYYLIEEVRVGDGANVSTKENIKSVETEIGKISDGYHTFDELYEHRCMLFIGLMRGNLDISWRSKLHHDGSEYKGWFIAGMKLPTGDISYHLPMYLWDLADVNTLDKAIEWDGHTSEDVVSRLEEWIKNGFN